MSGRRGKYHEWVTEEGCLKIEGWARDGLTDEQIAHNIGIAARTLYVWQDKYPQITQALKRGKEVVDRQVENALLKRALGYRYEEIKVEESEHGSNITTTTKEVVPDTTAQIFWLKNRKPQQWRDRPTEEDKEEQKTKIEQAKAGTEYTKEKIKLLKGEEKDTSIIESLVDLERRYNEES